MKKGDVLIKDDGRVGFVKEDYETYKVVEEPKDYGAWITVRLRRLDK